MSEQLEERQLLHHHTIVLPDVAQLVRQRGIAVRVLSVMRAPLLSKDQQRLDRNRRRPIEFLPVTWATCWYNVCQGMAAAFTQRDDVILGEMLHASAAVNTTKMKVFFDGTPLCSSQIINRCLSKAGATLFIPRHVLLLVALIMPMIALIVGLWVLLYPQALALSFLPRKVWNTHHSFISRPLPSRIRPIGNAELIQLLTTGLTDILQTITFRSIFRKGRSCLFPLASAALFHGMSLVEVASLAARSTLAQHRGEVYG